MNGEEYQVKTDVDGDIIPLSVGLYRFFMAHGQDGFTALRVYQHLIFTARLQHNNSVWANDSYLSQGLNIGTRRLGKGKAFLFKAGLIAYRQDRKPDGTLDKTYIRVNFSAGSAESIVIPDESTGSAETAVPVTGGALTAGAVDRSTGGNKQILEEEREILEEERKEEFEEPESEPGSQPELLPSSSFSDILEEVKTRTGMKIRNNDTVRKIFADLEERKRLDLAYFLHVYRKTGGSPGHFLTALADSDFEAEFWDEEDDGQPEIVTMKNGNERKYEKRPSGGFDVLERFPDDGRWVRVGRAGPDRRMSRADYTVEYQQKLNLLQAVAI